MRTTTSSKVINKSITKPSKSTTKEALSIKAPHSKKSTERIKAKVTPPLSPPSKDPLAPQNPPSPKQKPSTSKQQRLINLLSSSQGASIPELMIATGWQAHSIRGVISGVLRKRLGLTVNAINQLNERRYKIVSEA